MVLEPQVRGHSAQKQGLMPVLTPVQQREVMPGPQGQGQMLVISVQLSSPWLASRAATAGQLERPREDYRRLFLSYFMCIYVLKNHIAYACSNLHLGVLPSLVWAQGNQSGAVQVMSTDKHC